ncbi:MAG: FAD-dependent monooxygenase [Acidimicrobiales bacterium]|nr:FAD-dependent monooxygenase [Acidimicrobiales bacterium]
MHTHRDETHVVVVGGGPVGSLLAILLARRGLRVTIHESRQDPRSTPASEGRSINLTIAERGWSALGKAGVDAAVREITIPLYGRSIHGDDNTIQEQPYNERGDAIYSTSRAALSILLLELAEQTPGVTVRFEHRCVELDLENRELVIAGPQTTERLAAGVDFDVVFGADGAYSTLRQALLEVPDFEMDLRFSPIMYREIKLPAPPDGEQTLSPERLHLWPRGDGMIVGFPNLDRSHTLSIFLPATGPVSFESLSTRHQAQSFFEESCPDLLDVDPNLVRKFFRRPPSLLTSCRSSRLVLDDWLALIGDAAHAMVPFLGQGLNAGFEDCSTLADLVDGGSADWGSILRQYEMSRLPNGNAVVTMAEQHFQELAQDARAPDFILRKAIEQRIHQLAPHRFRPVYDMVAFEDVPYLSILETKETQDRLLDRIMGELGTGVRPGEAPIDGVLITALDDFEIPVEANASTNTNRVNPHPRGSGSDNGVAAMEMAVEKIRTTIEADTARVTATIRSGWWSEPREVWFELPVDYADLEILTAADPWLAALLLPAMRQQEALRVGAPLSPELLNALPQMEGIYSTWQPCAAPINVHTSGVLPHRAAGDAVGLFFSCGVDSWYSLLKSEDRRLVGRSPEVTHLVTVAGVDVDVDERKADIIDAVARNTHRVADELGLGALALSTNIRQLYTSMGISWHWGQAGALAAISLLLQSRFRKMIVAAGPTNANVAMFSEMEAGGCHPLLMPLFSTGLCEISIHGGEASRLQKVGRVVDSQLALDTLRICWASHETGYNCGRCAKCVRTALELEIVGALDRCATLPHPIDPKVVSKLRILFPHEILVLEERRDRLAEKGADPEILAALDAAIERSKDEEGGRERALQVIEGAIDPDEVFLILDEDELRFDLARTHANARPFTERQGVFNGVPADDDHALAELGEARRAGVRKFVIWESDFWALDYYPRFAEHLAAEGRQIAATPEVLVYEFDRAR